MNKYTHVETERTRLTIVDNPEGFKKDEKG